ncbi:glycoside hydrolase family 38 C-terminal domain-containing protein [Bacteroidota bacterium]
MNKIISLISCFYFILMINNYSQPLLKGYKSTIFGEELGYHSPQPDANLSLLVRSESSERNIEWYTDTIPEDFNEQEIKFLLLAGMDVNKEDPRKWDFFINDIKYFTISSPTDTKQEKLIWKGPDGSKLEFLVVEVDRYDDYMGYLFLTIPVNHVEKGKPLRLKVVGENAQSRTWFMIFQYETNPKVEIVVQNAVKKGEESNYQVLRAGIIYYGLPGQAKVQLGDEIIYNKLQFGYNLHYLNIPEVTETQNMLVKVTVGKELFFEDVITIKPVKHRTIYLLHHSHNDIGFTHVQDEVEKLQWHNLERSVELAEKSKDFPEGLAFKWNAEVMWAVDSYLKNTDEVKRKKLINAVREGWIELDALYANELTSLCNSEELIQLVKSGRLIAKECGVKLKSAMISDIPGWTWGIVPVLAKSGVQYFSIGTNSFHRIGNILKVWGDKPFYWVSPSGEDKILCWIHDKGYSMFHFGLDFKQQTYLRGEDRILDYMNELEENNYPYDVVMLRYNIGADNGPVDELLSEKIIEWNNNYVTPKIHISTVSEAFSIFEQKYGKDLPEYRGDMTAFWEDGAASSAYETSVNRKNASRIVQIQTVAAMLNKNSFGSEFGDIWRNILLFDEHTWGSWNSISEPESKFTLEQWKIKQSFAINAENDSKILLNKILDNRIDKSEKIESIEIINTYSWVRTDIVYIEGVDGNNKVIDEDGNSVPSQLLSDGKLAILAKNIPPFASKIYYLSGSKPISDNYFNNSDFSIESDKFFVSIDSVAGSINKIIWKETGTNLVDNSKLNGLNEYFYIKGRNPNNSYGLDKVNVRIIENGPLISSIFITSKAPGCNELLREIRLLSKLNRIDIINTINKQKVYEQEAVHIAFPFNIPEGKIVYDLAFAHCRLEEDQLPGSNRNFITIKNWVDISNEKYGVTWASPDAPLIEVGKITNDPIFVGWIEQLNNSQTLYSYVMNNYWETNYKAYQDDIVKFRYSIRPHEKFNPVEAEKFGIESRQPLIVIPVTKGTDNLESLFKIQNNNLLVVSVIPLSSEKGFLFRIFNPGLNPEVLNLNILPGELFTCDFDGSNRVKLVDSIEIPTYGLKNLIVLL